MKIIDGKVFGIPIRGQVSWQFLYWNRDLLSEGRHPRADAELDARRPDDQRPEAPAAREQRSSSPSPTAGSTASSASPPRCAASGGEFFEVPAGAGKKCTLDPAPCQQAIRWFYDNTKAGLFAPRAWGPAEFGQGKSAFLFGHLAGQRATVANNAKGAFEWTFDIVPQGRRPAGAAGSSPSTCSRSGRRRRARTARGSC